MPTMPTLFAFAVAAFLLAIVPGPNVIYITTRGISQGRRAAVASAFGVESGTFIHIGAAVVGLSAIIASSQLLFTALKLVGAGYLIWIGLAKLRAPIPAEDALPGVADATSISIRRIYVQGIVVQALNPKVALFFLAFLPQFIDQSRGSVTMQIVTLGLLLVVIGITSDLVYALASGGIGRWLHRSPQIARQRERFEGLVYVLLGAVTALSGSHRR